MYCILSVFTLPIHTDGDKEAHRTELLCQINSLRATEWLTTPPSPTLKHSRDYISRGLNSLGNDLREHSYALVCVWH